MQRLPPHTRSVLKLPEAMLAELFGSAPPIPREFAQVRAAQAQAGSSSTPSPLQIHTEIQFTFLGEHRHQKHLKQLQHRSPPGPPPPPRGPRKKRKMSMKDISAASAVFTLIRALCRSAVISTCSCSSPEASQGTICAADWPRNSIKRAMAPTHSTQGLAHVQTDGSL